MKYRVIQIEASMVHEYKIPMKTLFQELLFQKMLLEVQCLEISDKQNTFLLSLNVGWVTLDHVFVQTKHLQNHLLIFFLMLLKMLK